MAIELTIQPATQGIVDEPFTAVIDKSEASLGSSEQADVMLFGQNVAPIHAQLHFRANGQSNGEASELTITDMGSGYATLVGKEQIESFSTVYMHPDKPVVIGNYLVEARWIGKALRQEQAPVSEPQYSQDSSGYLVFEAVSICTLKGAVAQSGVGLAGIRIDGGALGIAVTDENGEFAFHGIPEGTKYKLSTSVEGIYFSPGVHEGRVTPSTAVQFEAFRLGAFLGVVTHNGVPVPGVHVDGGELGVCKTTAHGEFFFVQKPGQKRYRIRFSKPGYRFDPSYIEGEFNGQCLQASVTAQKVRQIRGKVLHNGLPMSGVEVNAGPLGSTITDAEGWYCFNDVPDGTQYRIVASKENYHFVPRFSRVAVRD